ncbi:outer membrane protein insertion porin family [Natronospira proteinivora]|uniref:Outer membrane protein assembly factor BamA n=1 Tax=Natronospira proteinivora TaxID=1807133 RepID=A0ABT1G6P5_9GAMM|nr:outer membrane protein assembly factor BamA [Natronospira proteinivora]MCP1726625.1 outer membrane protein insertion porin family [Natronospira proteinivora]
MRVVSTLFLGLSLAVSFAPVSAQVEPPESLIEESPDGFVVENIRLEGLQRIAESTVLSYLPLEPGDRADQSAIRDAIRELYATGFFDNVILSRDENTLVVGVEERPTIARLEISGNQQIETEMLRQAMREQGVAEGRVLNEQVVELLEQELYQTYYAQGRYGVEISPSVRELDANQVALNIEIKEGRVARIRQINLVGNEAFDDSRLKGQMELRPAGWRTLMSSRDQYSREKMTGDLEALRSYYMDRGYADFGIDSVQVSISPDRRDMYLSIHVDEGEVYTVSDVELIGEFPVPAEQLEAFVQVQAGETYSLAKANRSAEFIEQRLGASGYAHAEVRPMPELDRENQEVALTFVVDPGQRIYVREIRFSGSDTTDDQVYRREMRQFEGAPLANVDLDRSRVRMQRLPFVQQVNIEEVPVEGSPDTVDLDVNVEERNFGQFQVGVGYGGFTGLSANVSVQNNNLFGLGHQGQVQVQSNQLGEFVELNHTDPYATRNGVSRTIGGFYNSQSLFAVGQSPVSTKSAGMNLRFGFPISEYDSIRVGGSVRRSEFIQQSGTSDEYRNFIVNHGEQFTRGQFAGSRMDSAELNLAWVRDTRNRAIFPDRGTRRLVGLDVSVPGLDLDYWVGRVNQTSFLPLGNEWILKMDGEVSYGEPYGNDTQELPPFRRFFSGGTTSVRGYENARLGPLDSNNRPYGGSAKANLQTELILPNFFADDGGGQAAQYRFFVFADTGYVWDDIDDVSTDELRSSVGVGANWLTPMGLLRFSLARPINVRDEDRERGIVDRFQIDLGGSF